MPSVVVGLAGNPNCGKTTVFNALTGGHQQVGNWPGVTVERKEGRYEQGDLAFTIVDLPGVYALDVTSDASSLDERVAREYLLSGESDLLVNVVDASNLERNLYLTIQLIEMRLPLVVALNMVDVARDRGVRLEPEALERHLGCAVIPMVATRTVGVVELKAAIARLAADRSVPRSLVPYQPVVEDAIADLSARLRDVAGPRAVDPRWAALTALGDDTFASRVGGGVLAPALDGCRQRIEAILGEDVDIAIADSRYGFIHRVAREAAAASTEARRTRSDAIDRIVLHRALGIPIFLALMYLMFMITINVGGAFIDFFDVLGGTLFVKGGRAILEAIGSPGWLTTILADGVGRGLQIVGTFIPILGALFLTLAFLEDCGYMARAAFVMDRFMRLVGLPGKAFVPMLIGFGCNVPAIMATRTLEHPRDRLVTIMMNPFMSCGARLPVYALFAAAFFHSGGQTVVFGLYLIGIAMAVMTGVVLRRTLLRGPVSTFVMELPPYLLPTPRGLLLRTWDRLRGFLFRAGRVIVLIVVVLSLLDAIGTDGSFGRGTSERSVLSAIARATTPIFAPMGLTRDNWPALVGLVTGVFAKETVVGTLSALYAQVGPDGSDKAEDADEPFSVVDGVKQAFASIPKNLGELGGKVLDPLGLGIGDVGDLPSATEEQGVALGTYGAMVQRFDGKIGALAYLLFILLYFPCVAATAAVHRETTAGWTVFVAAWTTGWAYVVAVGFYQAATFARHPLSSALWITGLAAACVVTVAVMRAIGSRAEAEGPDVGATSPGGR